MSRVPHDLDLKPYKDEHDNALLRRMTVSLEQGPMRLGFRAYRVRDRRDREDYLGPKRITRRKLRKRSA